MDFLILNQMSQEDNIFTVTLVKKEGKLVHVNPGHEAFYKTFVESLEENQEVQLFFEANKDDGTNNQLAKIHVCIRKLAHETGYTFEEMKLEVKKRSGLVYGKRNYIKSFSDCSREELGIVLETITEISEIMNITL